MLSVRAWIHFANNFLSRATLFAYAIALIEA